ncbi:MAG: lactate utilization protein [Candidatus Thiodiazotropha sp. LLP2]
MSDARDQILQRLGRTSSRSPKPIPAPSACEQPSQASLIEQFSAMMEAVHGEVRVVDKDDWPNAFNSVVKEHQVKSLLIGPATWPGNRIQKSPPPNVDLLTYESAVENWKADLFHETDAAVTSAVGGVAETGSVALWPSIEEPRLMSLVPPLHIVLLDADQIFATFSELIDQQQWASNMPTNALLISGPSKSADIEQVLAYGVHGPKSLVIMILQ